MNLNEKIWRGSLSKTQGLGQVVPEIDVLAEDFFIPDNINPLNFAANFQMLVASDAAPLQASSLPAVPTDSLRRFIPVDARPSGFPLWFIAAYPDICLWLQSQGGQQEQFWLDLILQAFGSDVSVDFKAQDERGHLRKELLRKLIDQYAGGGAVLECRCSQEMLAGEGAAAEKAVRLKPAGESNTKKFSVFLLWTAAAASVLAFALFLVRG